MQRAGGCVEDIGRHIELGTGAMRLQSRRPERQLGCIITYMAMCRGHCHVKVLGYIAHGEIWSNYIEVCET